MQQCSTCKIANRLKQTISCTSRLLSHHLTCAGLARAQASELTIWHCSSCLRTNAIRDAVDDPTVGDAETPPADLASALAALRSSTVVLRHVPRGLRHRVAADLAGLITSALEQRTPSSWWRLLSYAYTGPLARNLHPPNDGYTAPHREPGTAQHSSIEHLTRNIKNKCADGDIRGVLRLLTSSDTVVHPFDETTAALQAKHLSAPLDEDLQLDLVDHPSITVTEDDLHAAINATPPGSSAGLDGIRPIHLRQLTTTKTAEAGRQLLAALTALNNTTIAGRIPDLARQAFFSARLIAIKKQDGGLRPIAVGSVYRRLAADLLPST